MRWRLICGEQGLESYVKLVTGEKELYYYILGRGGRLIELRGAEGNPSMKALSLLQVWRKKGGKGGLARKSIWEDYGDLSED